MKVVVEAKILEVGLMATEAAHFILIQCPGPTFSDRTHTLRLLVKDQEVARDAAKHLYEKVTLTIEAGGT